MKLCCALLLLGIPGALPAQGRMAKVFDVGGALATLEDKVGAVTGDVPSADRLERLITHVLKPEGKQALGQVVQRGVVRARQQVMIVQGDKELIDLVQSLLDEMRRDPLPRFHLTCTVLVMPSEIAAAHGLKTNEVQAAEMTAMTNVMRDVVKQKGTLMNLPETIATPFVPFVAEPRAAGDGKQPPNEAENLRLRGEAVALGPEEVLFAVQLVRGSLPEDRTVLPKDAVIDRAFRLRLGNGVTVTAKNDKTATVLWLRFTDTSSVTPQADKAAKADKKEESGKR